MKSKKYLCIYEDCRIVIGFKNTIIYDLGRPSNSNVIPESLVLFIDQCKNEDVETVMENGSNRERNIKGGYLEFLIQNDFAFIADEHLKKHIGTLDFKTDIHPELIYDAIICVNESNFQSAVEMIDFLDEGSCHSVELRIELLSIGLIEKLISVFKDTCIQVICLMMKNASQITIEFLESLLKNELRLRTIYVYEAPIKKTLNQIKFLTSKIDFVNDCGEVNKSNFNINQRFFTTSQSCNTCLNKKLSMDFNGKIKNCPSHKKSFGIFKRKNIRHIIDSDEFKYYGNIKKENVEICKDCEFRHMCLDCRAFTDEGLDLSRPSKCGYNPYIGKWKQEDGYIPATECGCYNVKGEFVINREKINKINAELWAEE